MQSSKKYFYILPVLVLSLLTGCWAPKEKSEDLLKLTENTSAAFYLTKVGGKSITPKKLESFWKIPQDSFFTFNACVKATATKQPIIGQKFEVVKGNKVYQTTDSNVNGCFTWEERTPFNFFADSAYVKEDRKLRAIDSSYGSIPLDIAIQPWAKSRNEDTPEVLHPLMLTKVPAEYWDQKQGVEAFSSSISHEKRLWANGGSLNIEGTENPNVIKELIHKTGYGLKIDMSLVPTVSLKKLDNTFKQYTLKNGTFRVFANIIADEYGTEDSPKVILNPQAISSVSNIDERTGKLNLSMQTIITGKPQGVLRLAIKMIPVGAPSDLQPFEYVYELGKYTQLLGKKTLGFTQEMNEQLESESYDSYMASAKNFAQLKNAHSTLLSQEPYHFNTLSVRFNRIGEGETSTMRTVQFKVESCITDAFGVNVPENSKWLVRFIRDNSQMPQRVQAKSEYLEPRFADDRGCIPWVDEITHKYYHRESYVFPKVEITPYKYYVAAKKEGKKPFTKTLGMAINPWDEKWTFGADIRSYDPRFLKAIRSRNLNDLPPSYLQIYDFSYVTIGFKYHIDKFMNLTVKKKVLLKLFPKVLKYNSIIFGRRSKENLRDGLYLMKIAIQKDYIDPTSKKPVYIEKNEEGSVRSHSIKVIDPKTGNKITLSEYKKRFGNAPEVLIKSGIKPRQSITAVTKLVRVNDGVIVTPVEFSMRDLRLMKMRSNMLIQLETIDEKALLAAITYEDYVKGGAKNLESILGDENTDRRIKRVREFLDNNPGIKFGKYLSKDGLVAESIAQMQSKRADQNMYVSELQKDQLKGDHAKNLESLVSRLQEHDSGLAGNDVAEMEKGSYYYHNREVLDSLYNSDEFRVPRGLIEQTDAAVRLNDFTVSKAHIDSVPIKLFVDKTTGLARRTFTGPVTFIFNSNSSSMRPTDNLDESYCPTDDCSLKDPEAMAQKIADNSSYERSKFFGSINHMQGQHVDDLIREKARLNKEYQNEMQEKALLYNYVKYYGMNYVSLENRGLRRMNEGLMAAKKAVDPDACTGKRFYECTSFKSEDSMPHQGLIKLLNKPLRSTLSFSAEENEEVTKETLVDFVENDVASDTLKRRICKYMATRFDKDGNEIAFHKVLESRCRRGIDTWQLNFGHVRNVAEEDGADTLFPYLDKPLDVNTQYIVNRTGRYRYKGGKSMNINVGTSFYMSKDVNAGVSNAAQLKQLVIPGLSLFNFGGRTDISRSEKYGQGINVNSQTFLVMQTATLDVELLGYEVCKIIKWNTQFLEENQQVLFMDKFEVFGMNILPGQDEKVGIQGKKLMICRGKNSEKPTAVRERYYYFTQHFTDGDMLDPGDLNNHPWLLQLRGIYNFRNFISMIEAKNYYHPYSYKVAEKVSTKSFPIDHLKKVYRNTLGTFPGIHTVVPEEGVIEDFPNNDLPADSFKMNSDADYEKVSDERGWFIEPGESN